MAKSGNFNYKQIEQLYQKLEKIESEKFAVFSETVIKELAEHLLQKVIERTPVKTGQLKQSWSISAVHSFDNIYVIEVFNPVFYAPYTEFGHRTPKHDGWVHGKFMLTISEQELKQNMNGMIEKKLKGFLQEIFS